MDKRVPISIIFTIIIQTALVFWYLSGFVATTEQRLGVLEEKVKAQTDLVMRITKMETIMENLDKTLQEVNKTLKIVNDQQIKNTSELDSIKKQR